MRAFARPEAMAAIFTAPARLGRAVRFTVGMAIFWFGACLLIMGL